MHKAAGQWPAPARVDAPKGGLHLADSALVPERRDDIGVIRICQVGIHGAGASCRPGTPRWPMYLVCRMTIW